MASTTYNDIITRLDGLESSELWLLLSAIQERINSRPKRSLKEFEPAGKLKPPGDEWADRLRSEWNDG